MPRRSPSPQAADTPLQARANRRSKYTATQVFDPSGKLLAEFRDMGPSAFDRNGNLVLAGRGGTSGYGIFRADDALRSTDRIDDGRIKARIDALDASPASDRLAFVFNGGLYEMDMRNGKPERLHAHGFPLAGVAYAPQGGCLSFPAPR